MARDMTVTVLVPETWQLEGLRRVMARLFTENRMTGDEMRDAAQTIQAVLATACAMQGSEGK